MPFEQGLAGAELCEDLVVGHGGTAVPLESLPGGVRRACRKISLEALEAWGKRAYRPGETGPPGPRRAAARQAYGTKACTR